MPAGARDFRKRRSKWISEGGAAGRQSHSNLGGGTNKVLGVPLLTSGNIYCTFLAGHAAALQILIFWIHSQCNILMLYSATNSRIFSLSRISKVWLVNKGRPAKSCKDGNDTHTYVYTYMYYVLRITYTCVYWTSATGSGDCEGEVMIHTYGLLWFGRDCRPWTIYVRKVSFSLLSWLNIW